MEILQRIDLIGDDAQILGDNREDRSQGILDGVKEFTARACTYCPLMAVFPYSTDQ